MSEEKETIADIVNDMRGNAEHNHALCEVSKYLTEIADRIEEAAKSEREAGADAAQICGEIGEIVGRATREESSQVGNSAAMREALLRCDAIAQMPEIREYLIVKDMRNLIKKALSPLIRGTAMSARRKSRMIGSKRFAQGISDIQPTTFVQNARFTKTAIQDRAFSGSCSFRMSMRKSNEQEQMQVSTRWRCLK